MLQRIVCLPTSPAPPPFSFCASPAARRTAIRPGYKSAQIYVLFLKSPSYGSVFTRSGHGPPGTLTMLAPLVSLTSVRTRSPSVPGREGPSVEKSVPNAEPFATPHIPGSYRLRRHFPRYCGEVTRVPHPYKLRVLPRVSRRVSAALRRRKTPSDPLQASTPSGRSELDIERPEAGTMRGSRFRVVATSWPSSRRESAPSRPSRGTGYG